MSSTRHVLGPFFRRQWSALVVAGVSTVVVAAAEVLRPFPLKFVIDHLFAGGGAPDSFDLGRDDFVLLAGVGGLVLAIALMEAAGGYLMDVRLMRAGERIVHDLRVAIYAHLQRLSLGYHQRRHTGDLVTRVTGDVNAVGTLFSSSLGTLVSSGLTLIGMVVVGFILDPLLALVAFATAPLLAVIAFRFRRRMKTLARQQRAMEGEIASLAAEALSSIQQVKALGSEHYEHERLERKSEERLVAGYEASLVEGRFTRVIDVLGAIGTAAVLVAGVFRVEAGALSPGDLVVMVAYARRVYRPLRSMAREWVRLSRAMARAERVAEVLSTDELLEERPSKEPDRPARGELEFEGVSFAYGAGRPALKDVSLTIPAGQRLAVAGRSGAGKSTLAALAARFYDPDAGRVLVDGVDARDYPLTWLRDQVGLVLQDPVLFTGTVTENIAWGIEASHEDVVLAAKAVGADTFIEELPEGYETELDPGGTGLSGGQRQRIVIARTLLRDPAILLLDEPTTGLDAESEAGVLEGLAVLMHGRTTVIITHSPGLERWADRVVTLEDGRLLRDSSPAERPAERKARDVVSPPRRRQGGPPIPDDAALPQMARVLDAEEMTEVLQRALGDGASPRRVGIRYLRYKPETNLVVQYGVELDDGPHDATAMIASGDFLERRAAKPENRLLARKVDGRSPSPRPLVFDPDAGCLIQWYPLDLSLPALAEPPDELGRKFRSIGVPIPLSPDEPAQLAYKPRRRAVVRLGRHVLKCYAKDSEFSAAAAALRASSTLGSVVVPTYEGALPVQRVTAQTYLPGRPVDGAAEAASAAGSVLSALHAAELEPDWLDVVPAAPPKRQLAAAAASARLVVAIAPALRGRVEKQLGELEQSAPEAHELVPCHGDFNARQLLMQNGGLALTDLDELCLAPPALDLATYIAYVVLGRPGDLATAERVLDVLLEGYGGRPRALNWYLATAILRRAPRPFRYFEPQWPDRVEGMVGAAEQALTW